jgi:hypothetical protein
MGGEAWNWIRLEILPDREAMSSLLSTIADWLRVDCSFRRYPVAPRQHPILFRRRLLEGIARELRKTELVVAHRSMSYSDTAW